MVKAVGLAGLRKASWKPLAEDAIVTSSCGQKSCIFATGIGIIYGQVSEGYRLEQPHKGFVHLLSFRSIEISDFRIYFT